MSFGILQTFLSRLVQYGMVENLSEMPTIFRQFQVKDEVFETVEFNIPEAERPPMNTIAEYIKKQKKVKK